MTGVCVRVCARGRLRWSDRSAVPSPSLSLSLGDGGANERKALEDECRIEPCGRCEILLPSSSCDRRRGECQVEARLGGERLGLCARVCASPARLEWKRLRAARLARGSDLQTTAIVQVMDALLIIAVSCSGTGSEDSADHVSADVGG